MDAHELGASRLESISSAPALVNGCMVTWWMLLQLPHYGFLWEKFEKKFQDFSLIVPRTISQVMH